MALMFPHTSEVFTDDFHSELVLASTVVSLDRLMRAVARFTSIAPVVSPGTVMAFLRRRRSGEPDIGIDFNSRGDLYSSVDSVKTALVRIRKHCSCARDLCRAEREVTNASMQEWRAEAHARLSRTSSVEAYDTALRDLSFAPRPTTGQQ